MQKSAPKFLHRLESLRGLAALMVAGHHAFESLIPHGWQAWLNYLILFGLNGGLAVTLFFVLSGLVLGMSLSRTAASFLDYELFLVRRVLRICPALWISSFLITLMLFFFGAVLKFQAAKISQTIDPGILAWISYWDDFNLGYLPKAIFFIDPRLNPPIWTLRPEMLCSFVLPILFWTYVRAKGLQRLLMLAFLLLIPLLNLGNGRLENYTNSRLYCFMFFLGMALPFEGQITMNFLKKRLPNPSKFVAPVSLMCAMTAWVLNQKHPYLARLIEGGGAAVFIAALLYGPELKPFKILDWSLSRFYGRISYSFYLYHMPCFYFVVWLVFKWVSTDQLNLHSLFYEGLFFTFSTFIATGIAWCSYIYVEKPAVSFSKRLCERIASKKTTINSA
jgi:peptidoglycan/LPS O-acetylase OafA/YrhL